MDTAAYSCALITGASAGIGAEFARQLAEDCEIMVLVARRAERLHQLADDLQAVNPHLEVFCITCDLNSTVDRERMLAELSARNLVPDLLINNAGLGDYGEFISSEWSKIQAMLRVNMEALTHLTHTLVPKMAALGGGSVLNVSSLASLLPIPDFAVYAATKAYVSSFSEALRIELAEYGIRVMALCPGPVHTEFGEVAGRSEERKFKGREAFYVDLREVVAEALDGLEANRPRVYPGLKVAIAAAAISLLPLAAIRLVMAFRPRREE